MACINGFKYIPKEYYNKLKKIDFKNGLTLAEIIKEFETDEGFKNLSRSIIYKWVAKKFLYLYELKYDDKHRKIKLFKPRFTIMKWEK